MSSRRVNFRLVKIHRNYTVEESAKLLEVHRNTVRQWIKTGLPTNDEKRPTLILGRVLFDFLQRRKMLNKRPCQPGQIYCVRCRCPKHPAGDMAEYQAVTATVGNLIGFCPTCETLMFRRVNVEQLAQIRGRLDVAVPKVMPHIVKSA